MKTIYDPSAWTYSDQPVKRVYASTNEAFPIDTVVPIEGPYRAPGRFASAVLWALSCALLVGMVFMPKIARLLGF